MVGLARVIRRQYIITTPSSNTGPLERREAVLKILQPYSENIKGGAPYHRAYEASLASSNKCRFGKIKIRYLMSVYYRGKGVQGGSPNGNESICDQKSGSRGNSNPWNSRLKSCSSTFEDCSGVAALGCDGGLRSCRRCSSSRSSRRTALYRKPGA